MSPHYLRLVSDDRLFRGQLKVELTKEKAPGKEELREEWRRASFEQCCLVSLVSFHTCVNEL